jgi:TonB family protein
MTRTTNLTLLAGVFFVASAVASSPDSTQSPQVAEDGAASVIENLNEAALRGDARSYLQLFDPRELKEVQDVIVHVLRLAEQHGEAAGFLRALGVDSPSDLLALPPEELMLRIYDGGGRELEQAMEIVGRAEDGPDTVHFVVRPKGQRGSVKIQTVRRVGDGWAAAMPSEIMDRLNQGRALVERAAQSGPGADRVTAEVLPPTGPPSKGTGGSDAKGGGPMFIQGDVVPPTVQERVRPQYPEKARVSRLQGSVLLQVIIDEDGRVEDVQLLRSIESVAASLDEAAKEAVRQWRYSPATENGKPVKVYSTVTVNFSLNGDGK